MTGSTAGGLPKALEHDWPQLTALVDAYSERQPIPCRMSPMPGAWIGDDEGEQANAAAECRTCPALIACRRYGLEHLREPGVYGGLTYQQRRATARQTKENRS
ncbi:WhiB family transcriptional regulator [Demequina capsici]|uniref:WhiB family transcriptional regulator n=1 Tax=Demequina capsici TaxID=3075620 RepID=A0AA96FFG5_9MICO|nr:WhiB family transcriptional regulator [Demequina sp. PMTSA13]WNM28447.1 WhiB family transcriptional regulator [Demequina sp. PMTSA13]